ncbi:MAG: hypothetical protein HQ521_07265 [Bacteroidetes bacterium]|nr:hypothetical protein [Bacteroidota bacterium]
MDKINEFFKIINEYKLIDIRYDEDYAGSTLDYVLNDFSVEELQVKLNNLYNDLKYVVVQQSENVIKQLGIDITEAKKDFNYHSIEGVEYVFQKGIKKAKYGSGKNIRQLIQDIEEGVHIELENVKYKEVETYHLFSEIKLNFLDALENLLLLYSSNTHITNKLKTKMSVGDLSLLFRLLNEEKLIDIDNNTDLYRFIAQNFSTKQSENISDKSIKNKFLSPDNTAIKNLNILLVNLRQQLKKIQ